MKVLVVGGGGREHALVWKIAQSPRVARVFCAPGNAGISQHATLVPIRSNDLEGLLGFALQEKIDLTVVGPEEPLTKGIVDLFESKGLPIFGPNRSAAEIEGSKAFAKEMMKKYRIPTASYEIFSDQEKAMAYARNQKPPLVVKADGLAAGKGAVVCKSTEEALQAIDRMMGKKIFGEAGNRVVIEECLFGEEASFIALTDGEAILPLASSQDHKAVFDGDQGPNTGGMGAYSPAPVVTDAVHQRIVKEILKPIVKGMAQEGRPYKGALYAGVMICDDRAKVLEFNARFGDPETQPAFMRMRGDLVPLLEACLRGDLSRHTIEWDPRASVCVVMASKGYPGDYDKGKVISGLEKVCKMKDVFVFHAGTALENGRFVTSGGRVLGVTALGDGISKAIEIAYEAVHTITWEGVHFRTDIGARALKRTI